MQQPVWDITPPTSPIQTTASQSQAGNIVLTILVGVLVLGAVWVGNTVMISRQVKSQVAKSTSSIEASSAEQSSTNFDFDTPEAAAIDMRVDGTDKLLYYNNGSKFVALATQESVQGGNTGGTVSGGGTTVVQGSTTNIVNTSVVSLPQSIAVSASPTFQGLSLGSALGVASGGTGGTSAAAARASLGVAVSGSNSDITQLSGLTTALSVAQGGTGSSNFATGGVLAGNGGSALQVITSSSSGQCFMSTVGGTPVFQTCPSGGNVSAGNPQSTNRLTKFSATTNQIVDSLIVDDGTILTAYGDFTLANGRVFKGDGSGLTNVALLNAANTFAVNSASALVIQNSTGAALLTADTNGMTLTVGGNIALGGHIKSTQTTAPTIGTPATCGTTPTATITAGSTDSAGSLTVTTGAGALGAGTCDTVVSFNSAYGTAPKAVVLTPKSQVATNKSVYVSASSTTSFTVTFGTAAAVNSQANDYYFWVVE